MNKQTFIDTYKVPAPELSFENLSGFAYEKDILTTLAPSKRMDDLLYIPNTKLFLFSGPEGYGKHALANALANYLAESGYEFFVIDCEELAEENDRLNILSKLFTDVFECTSPENPALYRRFHILFDNFDYICEDKSACKILKKTFELLESDYSGYDCDCIISAIASDAGKIPSGISKSLYIFELELPTEEERKEYFSNEFLFEAQKNDGSTITFVPIEDACPEALLARLTEGLSFADMRKVVLMSKLFYKQQAGELYDYALLLDTGIDEHAGFLTEEQLSAIVSKVKKGKQAAKVKKQESAVSYMAPQVVYAAPPGMMAYNPNMNMGADVSVNADIDDPNIVNISLYESIPEEEDLKEYFN